MKQQLIQLAKEKGLGYKDFLNNLQSVGFTKKEAYYLWMCVIQKCLRDEHNIHVVPMPMDTGKEFRYKIIKLYKHSFEAEGICFGLKSNEIALESGLIEAFKLIKK